ncbi:LysR family transcriptional regulator [Clostridium drakei]|uniref:HTH lysR-type domain-containing protein n=1 Tax=Clostridium drakei TaxID=332101 RepID=A0A2U8DMD4_9CLOT|nr:LysR family transcriptional regulator [Clostridium drakei]AWI03595.1 hypothetical protein B9W14_03555 [Clostridium drakei]
MDILQLKYFQTVARYQHITKAANKLNISQPSLTIIIKRLEKELGTQLFKHTGRNIELNEAGKTFLNHVNQVFSELDIAKYELKKLSGPQDNKVSLATTSSRFLSGLLKDFLLTNQEVGIRQFTASIEIVRDFLINEKIDYCISSPPIEGSGIECIELLNDEIVLCLPANHPLAHKKSIHLREVADEKFISLIDGYSFREVTDNLCNIVGFSPNVICECDTVLMSELLQINRGIALIPKSAQEIFQNPALVFLQIEEPICRRKIGLSWLQGRYLSKAARNFQELTIHYYKNMKPWKNGISGS